MRPGSVANINSAWGTKEFSVSGSKERIDASVRRKRVEVGLRDEVFKARSERPEIEMRSNYVEKGRISLSETS